MNKGGYLLILYLDEDREIEVGSLGKFLFKKGYYIYVGSAMNSLTDRVKRHLKREKRKHWHIDYLLDFARILFIILIPFEEKIECKLANYLSGKILVEKFGSTDCNCKSHLFFYENFEDLLRDVQKVLKNFSSFFQ